MPQIHFIVRNSTGEFFNGFKFHGFKMLPSFSKREKDEPGVQAFVFTHLPTAEGSIREIVATDPSYEASDLRVVTAQLWDGSVLTSGPKTPKAPKA